MDQPTNAERVEFMRSVRETIEESRLGERVDDQSWTDEQRERFKARLAGELRAMFLGDGAGDGA